MNAEIVHRLQESFDIPDQAGAIAADVASEIESELYGVHESFSEIQSQIRAILAHLGLPDPAEEARARKTKERTERKASKAELQAALEALEKQGFKVARIPKQTAKDDDGEGQ